MSKGMEIRAQVDSELVKGLLLINGGGAVAVLAFLPSILTDPAFAPLSRAVLWSLLAFQIGLTAAVIHNRLRRVCSLEFEKHNYNPPACKSWPLSWLKFANDGPCVCRASTLLMWVSIASFVVAGTIMIIGGFAVIDVVVGNGEA